jgi:type IV secretory pathway VirJ component
MLSRMIAPAALLLLAASFAAVAADAPPKAMNAAKAKQNTQVSKSTNAAAKAAAKPAKPKPPAHDPQATRIIDFPGVGEVTVYAPQGPARGLALFASGDGGWNLGVWDMAHTAAELGYWVGGFSTPAFLRTLEASNGSCSDASGLLDQISNKVKKEMKLPAAARPVLIGYSSGATIAYAALAQAGDTRFGGAMTLGFCPDLIIHKSWCEGAGGLTATKMSKAPYTPIFNTVPVVKSPWIVLQGEIDQVCNPPATEAFVRQVKGGHIVMLPKVGHGYSVTRNWMPQYRQGLSDLLKAAAQPADAAP